MYCSFLHTTEVRQALILIFGIFLGGNLAVLLMNSYKNIASYPGSSQFFNDACRKMRESGKIHHVHYIWWKGLAAVRAPFKNLARERLLVYLHFLQACLYLTIQVCLTKLSFRCTSPSKSPMCMRVPCKVTSTLYHMHDEFYNCAWLPRFSTCIIEELGGAWVRG